MEANELRIGNVVKVSDTGEIIKVEDMNYLGIDSFDQEPKYYYNEIAGVELTEEILLRMGCEKLSYITMAMDGVTYWGVGNIEFYELNNKYYFNVNRKVYKGLALEFDKVHELQNLIFTLTKKELQWH